MSNHSIQELSKQDIAEIIPLVHLLQPEADLNVLEQRMLEMLDLPHYKCMGFYVNDELLGVTGLWLLTKLYSGKQVEIDNLVLHPSTRSKGYGTTFLELIHEWAVNQGCQTIELNTYVQNSRSHKFYYNLGYKILGFHFQKKL